MPLETRLDGDPDAIRAVADYLRGDLGGQAGELATTACAQRSDLASTWEGRAGDAFGVRASALSIAADALAAQSDACGRALEALAASLGATLEGLATVRDRARSAGLTSMGTTILEPAVPSSPDLQRAWDLAARETTRLLAGWHEALDAAAAGWRGHASDLAGLAGGLIIDGYEAALLARLAPVLSAEAAEQLTLARQLQAHADAMVRDGHFIGQREAFGRLLDDRDLARWRAGQVAELAEHPELPRGLRGGVAGAGGALAVITTAWGVRDDLVEGEPVEQAVVSNVGGTVAGIAAGAAAGAGIGAAVGSVVPGAGTAVGAAGGALVGTAVGVVTSGAIDSAYEDGVDSVADVGEAAGDGLDDLVDLGDAGVGAVRAIF